MEHLLYQTQLAETRSQVLFFPFVKNIYSTRKISSYLSDCV